MFFYLGDSFRLLISRGLSEYYTLLLLLLMIIISLNNNIKKYSFIIILSILGIILSWIREEKLLTAISVMFLFIHIKDLNYNNPIIGIFSKLKENFKINLVFLIILITGFPILFEVRNFIVAENSTIATHPSVLKISFDSYYKIIFGSEFGSFPKPFSIFVILSLFIILNTIFFKKINRLMPYFGISIIYLSLVIPFILLEIPGYVPRHSISIFAISLLILGIFVNNYLKKNNYIKKYFNRAK
jgi:uncharacterized membrane protein